MLHFNKYSSVIQKPKMGDLTRIEQKNFLFASGSRYVYKYKKRQITQQKQLEAFWTLICILASSFGLTKA